MTPDAKRLDDLLEKYTAPEPPDPDSTVTTVWGKVTLVTAIAAEDRAYIGDCLMALPKPFRMSAGGGWSTLNGAFTDDGTGQPNPARQWGEQRNVFVLAALGLACDYCSLTDPAFSAMLPGGMPYLMVHDDKIEADRAAA